MTVAQCRSIIRALRQGDRRQLELPSLETLRDGLVAEVSVRTSLTKVIGAQENAWLSLFLVNSALQLKQGTAQHPNTPGSATGIAGDRGTPELGSDTK